MKVEREQIRPNTMGAHARWDRGTVRWDVTVKSAQGMARALAPDWAWVMGLKRGQMTEAQYKREYRERYREARKSVLRMIRLSKTLGAKRIVFLCYCRDNQFCHTHLLREWLMRDFRKEITS